MNGEKYGFMKNGISEDILNYILNTNCNEKVRCT